jgi:hypothetical protein
MEGNMSFLSTPAFFWIFAIIGVGILIFQFYLLLKTKTLAQQILTKLYLLTETKKAGEPRMEGKDWNCPECGFQNSGKASICSRCGKALKRQ